MELEVVGEVVAHSIIPNLTLLLLRLMVERNDLHLLNRLLEFLLILGTVVVVVVGGGMVLALTATKGCEEFCIVRQRLIFWVILVRNSNNKVLDTKPQTVKWDLISRWRKQLQSKPGIDY
jgi:hypothetical protein